MNLPDIFSTNNPNRPKWLQTFIDFVRPGGVALMFLVITVLPLIFAIVEIFLEGVGVRMANVLASYFRAVPDIFYDTLQIMFIAYVAGKSAEKITDKVANRRPAPAPVVNAEQASVTTETGDVNVQST